MRGGGAWCLILGLPHSMASRTPFGACSVSRNRCRLDADLEQAGLPPNHDLGGPAAASYATCMRACTQPGGLTKNSFAALFNRAMRRRPFLAKHRTPTGLEAGACSALAVVRHERA